MPTTVFQPRLLEKNPAWNSGKSAGVHHRALMVARTRPQTSALAMFPRAELLHGRLGRIAVTYRTVKTTPVKVWAAHPRRSRVVSAVANTPSGTFPPAARSPARSRGGPLNRGPRR